MLTPPCKDCPERYLGCHSSCEKYQMFREERNKFNSEKKAKEDSENWFAKRSEKSMKKLKYRRR